MPQTADCGAPPTQCSNYVGHILSFLVIGVLWANHHTLFEYIKRTNRALIVMNLLLLMGVGFLPFPTAVPAANLADPTTRTAATAFYGATLIFTSFTFNALWWLGRGHGLLRETDVSDCGVRTITRRYGMARACYAVATASAFVNVWLSLSIHFVLALWNGFSERV